ncbi:MAG: hypothetical protein HPY76_14340 [Anaerolineae bacterium]|nr:hypothetical protein [Anaerolineae bacterium]
MKHQPFENWILESNIIDIGDRQLLEDHLDQCSECRKLNDGLVGFEKMMRNAELVAAPEGFNDRWRETFQQRKLAAQKKQTRIFTSILLIMAVISLSVLIYYTIATTSPADVVIFFTKSVVSLINVFAKIQPLLQPVFGSPVGFTMIIFIVMLALIGIGFISSIWLTVIWRYTIKGTV